MNPVQMMDKVFEPHGVSISGNGTLTENVYGFPHTWAGKYQEEWLKRMITYWGDDLGAPSGRNDVARTHEEYDVKDARAAHLLDMIDADFMVRARVEEDPPALSYSRRQFPRANVPADKDKRVRLSYLLNLGDCVPAEGVEELVALGKEVSPWGGEVAT